jgi:hypothetical protein
MNDFTATQELRNGGAAISDAIRAGLSAMRIVGINAEKSIV